MKTSTLLLAAASAVLTAADCPGLVPCVIQAQEANGNCDSSLPSCFCLAGFLTAAQNCLTSNGCPAQNLDDLNLSYEYQCPNGPPSASSSSVLSTSLPGIPTDTSSSTPLSTLIETVPVGTVTPSSTAAPETTGSSAASSDVNKPSSTEGGPESTAPVETHIVSSGVPSSGVPSSVHAPTNGTQKMTTSTIYTTQVRTVTHCPETVTDCPTRPHVTTETIAVSTTVCPIEETHKVPAPPASTPVQPGKPSQGSEQLHTKTWLTTEAVKVPGTTEVVKVPGTTEVVKVPGTVAGGNNPGSPASSQGSTPSTPIVVTAGAVKAAFSVGGALVAAFAALL